MIIRGRDYGHGPVCGHTLPSGRALRSIALGALLSALLFGGAACSEAPALPKDDGEKIVRSALVLLASQNVRLCVDNETRGLPLSVFRTMTMMPGPDRPFGWYEPAALRPPPPMTNAELYRANAQGKPVHLNEPENTTPRLSDASQSKLNGAARVLARTAADRSVSIRSSWQVPGMSARWWGRNLVSSRCTPNYVVSNPVVSTNVGFVSVTANHWGTTYAFVRRNGDWAPIAQWSNWLY